MHFTPEQRDAWYAKTKDSPFNRWLRERTSDRQGRLDLAALRTVAAEFGVDGAAYAHLNPGQQRMNIGNRLRRIVPPAYLAQEAYANSGPMVQSRSAAVAPPVLTPPTADPIALPASLADATNVELLRLHTAILDELRCRAVIRTSNAPLGDYAEHLFAKAFGWTLAHNSAAGHDATDRAGLRYQVKARRLATDAPGKRQLSAIRALPEAKFDMLAGLLLDHNYQVRRAALIPHAVVLKRSIFIAHVNGWRMMLTDDVWREPSVRDVTPALAAAA